jgi:hypothetical protein
MHLKVGSGQSRHCSYTSPLLSAGRREEPSPLSQWKYRRYGRTVEASECCESCSQWSVHCKS